MLILDAIRFALLPALSSTAGVLLARGIFYLLPLAGWQQAGDSFNLLDWAQLGLGGTFGGVCLYVMLRTVTAYQAKEIELNKAHADEIRRLNDGHTSEIKRMHEAHTAEVKRMQDAQKEELLRRTDDHNAQLVSHIKALEAQNLRLEVRDGAVQEVVRSNTTAMTAVKTYLEGQTPLSEILETLGRLERKVENGGAANPDYRGQPGRRGADSTGSGPDVSDAASLPRRRD